MIGYHQEPNQDYQQRQYCWSLPREDSKYSATLLNASGMEDWHLTESFAARRRRRGRERKPVISEGESEGEREEMRREERRGEERQ